MTRHIVVLPYDKNWKTNFIAIKNKLSAVLGDLALRIEHVGSTSIEGCFSKPIIDIDVVIENYSVLNTVILKLEQIGYNHKGDMGIKDREVFEFVGEESFCEHHLYVCTKYSSELKRHIGFRDYLRANPKEVEIYSNIKIEGARLYANDIEEYMKYKSYFIKKVYKKLALI